MQTDSKQIYKELAQETGKSEQIYKDIGNFIWAETYAMIRRPQSLITKLKGIGSWHLRRKRMTILVEDHPLMHSERTKEDFTNEKSYDDWLWRKELRTNFAARLKDYEDYVTLRNNIRELRRKKNEDSVLLETTKREDQSSPPS